MHLSRGNEEEAKKWFERTAGIGGAFADRAGKALEEM
jgi:hypothetical protein